MKPSCTSSVRQSTFILTAPCSADQQRERDFTAAYQPPSASSGSKITDLSYAITPGALVFEAHEGLPDDICQPFQRRDRWAPQLRAFDIGTLRRASVDVQRDRKASAA